MLREILFVIIAQILVPVIAEGAPRVDKPVAGKSTRVQPAAKITKAKPATVTKGTPMTNINLPLKAKQQNLTAQKVYKTTQSAVNFDETEIKGEAVRPVVSSISGDKSDPEFDLIPLRKKWHSEMIDSSLEY